MSSGMSKTQKVIWDLWCQKHPLLSLQGLQMREKPAGFRMRSRCKCRKLPLRAGVWGVLQSPSPRWGAWSRGCGWPTPPTCKRRAACASGQRGVLHKAGSSARWGHERWGWGMAMFLVPHAPQRSPPPQLWLDANAQGWEQGGCKGKRRAGMDVGRGGRGSTLSLGALSHPRRLVPRSCSAATEKLNFAHWEYLSQPWFCYCVQKKKKKKENCPDYMALLPLLSTSNESDVFQTLWPDDRTFKCLCPALEIELNHLTAIKHVVRCGRSPPVNGRPVRQRQRN